MFFDIVSQCKRLLLEDVAVFVSPQRRPRGVRLALKVTAEPGLQFAALLRLQLTLEQSGSRVLARIVHLANLRLTGGEVGHGCTVGPGLVAKHPLGVVLGGGSVLGRHVTVLHNVVLGERVPGAGGQAYPVIGDDVLIGNAAVILGSVRVGAGSVIGANAVVINDVPAGATVVGIPAAAVHRRSGSEGRVQGLD